MRLSQVTALAVSLASSAAFAAADLAVSVAAPAGVRVYESGSYGVTVRNIGNKSASGVSLVVTLPQTGTSPGVSLLGTLGTFDSRCTRTGVTLTCTLGTLARSASTVVGFNLAIPYSTRSLAIASSATTTSVESGPGVNNVSTPVAPLTYPVTINTPATATNLHCTGTSSLSSFFECELYPSSISGHTTILNADGTIAFVGVTGYTGTWSQPTPDSLVFEYFEAGQSVASFSGKGTNSSCFEGVTTFPGSSYISIYEVCL